MKYAFQTYHYIAPNRKQITCSLYEEGISCTVQTKDGLLKNYKFRYTDICKIHLGLPDIAWHAIDIYFWDKTHIHLKSVTFFIERENRKLQRPKTNEADNAIVRENQRAYREFVVGLHERTGVPDSTKHIRFIHGNPWKKTMIWIFLLALITSIPITLKMGYYRWSLFFVGGFLFLLSFSRKIDFKKLYPPDQIPAKYLPPGFSEKPLTKLNDEQNT